MHCLSAFLQTFKGRFYRGIGLEKWTPLSREIHWLPNSKRDWNPVAQRLADSGVKEWVDLPRFRHLVLGLGGFYSDPACEPRWHVKDNWVQLCCSLPIFYLPCSKLAIWRFSARRGCFIYTFWIKYGSCIAGHYMDSQCISGSFSNTFRFQSPKTNLSRVETTLTLSNKSFITLFLFLCESSYVYVFIVMCSPETACLFLKHRQSQQNNWLTIHASYMDDHGDRM